MKYFYYLFFLGIFIQAQLPQTVMDNVWYLRDYEDGSETSFFDFMNSTEFEEITLEFYIEDETLHYRTKVCSEKTGIVIPFEEGEENTIQFINNQIEGNPCVEQEIQNFELAYFSHIYDEFNYWYYLTENEDGSLNFSLGSPNFCSAIFSNKSLSTSEISQNAVEIYPNPVQNKLTIENPDLEINQIKITDATGKLVLHQKINLVKTIIDFSQFPKGIYFLTSESSKRITKTQKIIRN